MKSLIFKNIAKEVIDIEINSLKKLKKGSLNKLNIEFSKKYLKKNNKKGIF